MHLAERTRSIFRVFTALAILCGCVIRLDPLYAQEGGSTPMPTLTLDQAISEAQVNNRLVKASQQSVLFANEQIQAVKTQRYPHFNVQLSGSYLLNTVDINIPAGTFGTVDNTPIPQENKQIVTKPRPTGMAFAQVYQPLAELYSLNLNVKLAQSSQKLSEEQLRQERQQITDTVKEDYYALLQTQSALEAARENVKALEEVDRTTQQYVEEKTALAYQGAGVKVQLAQAQLQVVTLEDTLQTQKESLNDVLGRDISADFQIAGVPEALPEEQSLELARKTALANRTEIKQAQIKIDQAVLSRRIQKAEYIPNFGVQYLDFAPFSANGLPNNISTIGVTLKWDIFDWGYKKHLLAEKDTAIEQSRLNLTETSNQVLIDLDNRYRKLREARAGMNVAQMAQEAEKEKLDVVMEQYKQKAALLSTLQTEQANMAQATSQYQQALATFWTARADFEKSLGED